MPFAGLLNQPGVVERWGETGTKDNYGNAVKAKASEYPANAYREQTDATEMQVDRETVVSNWLLVLAAGSAIDAGDRWVDADGTFEVIGLPHRVWNPRRRIEHHVEVRLRLVGG